MATPLSLVDPIYKVLMDARPSNYLVNHVSWEKPSNSINWTGLKVIRSTTGYPQDPGDGTEIYSAASDDIVLLVDGVNSTTGALTSVSVLQIGAALNVAFTSASPISVGADLGSPTTGGKGRRAVISISSVGVPTINSAGGGYSIGDILRISGDYTYNGSTLPGRTKTTQLGIENAFHIYDKGASSATTVNPGYGVTGTDLNVNKYYYSVFVYYVKTPTTTAALNAVTPSASVYWKKIGEVSSSVVRKSAIRDTKSLLLDHLPAMYKINAAGSYNSDLDAFLSLFAFHLDTYLAKSYDVYSMTNVKTIDETLLNEFLKQFGVPESTIPNVTQARSLLKNIIRTYQIGGTVPGLQEYIEAYTGLLVKEVDGNNLLLDYNTSSFVETIGSWYPSIEANYLSSFNFETGAYTEELYGNATSGKHNISLGGMSATNIDPYMTILSDLAYTGTYSSSTINPVYNARLTVVSATSGSKTIVVDDTSKLVVGYKPLVISGTGSFPVGTVITKIVDSTTFKINKALAVNISTGAVITVSRNLTSSMIGLRSDPTTGIGQVKFYSGRRKTYLYNTSVAASSGSSVYSKSYTLRAVPCTVKVGDYIQAPEITKTEVRVKSVDYTTGLITVDKDISVDIEAASYGVSATITGVTPSSPSSGFVTYSAVNSFKAGQTVLIDSVTPTGYSGYFTIISATGTAFTVSNSTTGVASFSGATATVYSFPAYLSEFSNRVNEGATDTIPVKSSTPYTFSMNFNANGATTLPTEVSLTWFDAAGNTVSTSTATATAPSSTTTWYPTSVSAVSPASAAYASPAFVIGSSSTGPSTTAYYYADAAMLSKPVSVYSYAKNDALVTVRTNEPHNFYPGNLVAVTLDGTSGLDTTVSTSLSLTGLLATSGSVRYTAANSLIVGQYVSISGIGTTAGYNGTFQVTGATSTTFTVLNSTTGAFTTTNAKVTTVPYITDVSQDSIKKIYTFTYANPQVTTAGTSGGTATGYASSIPMYTDGTTPRVVFEDARTTKLNIIGSRINLCANPNFEASTSGWTANSTSITATNTNKYVGSQSLRIAYTAGTAATSGVTYSQIDSSATSVGYPISVTEGLPYYLTGYLLKASGDTTINMIAVIKWFNNASVQVGTATGTATLINSSAWTRVSVAGTAPVGAATATVSFYRNESTTANTVVLLDAVLMEQSDTLNTYFDGSFDGFSYDVSRDSIWSGLANLSHSHLYPGRVEKQGAIDKILTEVIYYA